LCFDVENGCFLRGLTGVAKRVDVLDHGFQLVCMRTPK